MAAQTTCLSEPLNKSQFLLVIYTAPHNINDVVAKQRRSKHYRFILFLFFYFIAQWIHHVLKRTVSRTVRNLSIFLKVKS